MDAKQHNGAITGKNLISAPINAIPKMVLPPIKIAQINTTVKNKPMAPINPVIVKHSPLLEKDQNYWANHAQPTHQTDPAMAIKNCSVPPLYPISANKDVIQIKVSPPIQIVQQPKNVSKKYNLLGAVPVYLNQHKAKENLATKIQTDAKQV